MSEIVDKRVVSMEMDNEQFKKEAEATIKELEKLEKSIDTKGMEKNLSSLEKTASSINLDGLAKSIDRIQKHFTAFGVIGDQILRSITNSAIYAGKEMIKALSTDPLRDGLSEYETEINSVKVIMANLRDVTQSEVNDALAELNEYADLTVYNFGQMTDAIGKFTAAGVDLKTSTQTIKGLANVAAGAGVSNSRLAGAYVQVSQALQAGVFKLMDWNSLQNAGLANEEFRNKLQDTAIEMGILTGRVDNFRDSLQKGWLTTEVFTKTLEKASSTDNEWGRRLTAAATEVTTFTQLIGTIKEGLGTAWSTSIKYILGDFTEAKQLFTGLSNIIGGIISQTSEGRNQALKEWHDLGGRESLLQSLKNLLASIASLLYPIKTAFNEVFEPLSGSVLLDITKRFEEFTRSLFLNEDSMEGVYTIAKAIAVIIKTLLSIAKSSLKILGKLLKIVGSFSSALLDIIGFLGKIAKPLANIIKQSKLFQRLMTAIVKIGDNISNFFSNIIDAISEFVNYLLQIPLLSDVFTLLGSLVLKVAEAFVILVEAIADFDIRNISKWLTNLIAKFASLFNFTKQFSLLNNIIKSFGLVIAGVFVTIIELAETLIGVIFNLGSQVKESFSLFDIGKGLGSGVIGVLSYIINGIRDFGRGIKEALSTENMEAIDWVIEKITQLKDNVVSSVKEIYSALSKLDWNKLFVAAISLVLVTSLYNLSVGIKSVGEGLSSVSASIKTLSAALKKKLAPTRTKVEQLTIFVGTMVTAILVLSKIPQEELDKAMKALTVLMGMLVIFEAIMLVMSTLTKKMKIGTKFQASLLSIAGIGVAVAAMAGGLWLLQDVPLEGIVPKILALLSIMTVLGAVLTLMSKFSGKNMVGTFSIIAFALAVGKITEAFAKFAEIPLENIQNSMKSFLALMGGLSLLMFGIGQMNLRGVLGLIIFANYIDLIIEAFKKIGDADFTSLYDQLNKASKYLIFLGAFVLGVLALTRKVKFGGGFASVGIGLLGIATAIRLILGAYAKFPKDMNVGNFLMTTTALGVILIAITTMISSIARLNREGKSFQGAASTLLSLSVLLGTVSLVLGFMTLLNDIPAMILSFVGLSALFVAIGAMLHSLAKVQSGKRAVGTLGLITVLITALELVVAALNTEKWYKTLATTLELSAVFVALGFLMQSMVKAFNGVETAQFTKVTKMLKLMTGVFAIIGGVLVLVNHFTSDIWNFLAVGGTLILCVAALAELSTRLIKGFFRATESQFEKSTKTLELLTKVFVVVGAVLGVLNNVAKDAGLFLAHAIIITSTVFVLVKIAKVLKDDFSGSIDQNALKNAYRTMELLTGVFAVLAGTMWAIRNVQAIRMGVQLLELTATIGALAFIAKKLTKGFTSGDKNMRNAIRAMTTLTVVFVVMAGTLWAIKDVDAEYMLYHAGTLIGAITALSSIAWALGKFSTDNIGGLLTSVIALGVLTVAVAALAAVLKDINKLNVNRFAKQAAVLVAAIGSLGLISVGLSKLSGTMITGGLMTSLQIIAFSYAVTLLADALVKLSAVPSDQLWNIIGGISALVAVLTLAGTAFSMIATAFPAGAGIMIATLAALSASIFVISLAANIFAIAIQKITDSIKSLSQITEEETQNIINNLLALGAGIGGGIAEIITSFVDGVIQGIKEAINNAFGDVEKELKEDSEKAGKSVGEGMSEGVKDIGPKARDAGKETGNQAIEGMAEAGGVQIKTGSGENSKSGSGNSYIVGKSVGTSFGLGVHDTEATTEANEAGTDLVNSINSGIENGVTTLVSEGLASLKTSVGDTLKDIMQAFIDTGAALTQIVGDWLTEKAKLNAAQGGSKLLNFVLGPLGGTSPGMQRNQKSLQEVEDALDARYKEKLTSVIDNTLSNFGNNTKNDGKGVLDNFKEGISNALGLDDSEGGLFGGAAKEITGFLDSAFPKIQDLAKEAIDETTEATDEEKEKLDDLGKSAGGATSAIKEFEDTLVEIPEMEDSVTSSMTKFIEKFAASQKTLENPNFLPALEAGYHDFIAMQYNAWASTEDGIQKIKEEEEEIERLSKEAVEAGVEFDAEAKRTEYRLRDMSQAWLDLRNNLVDTIQNQIDIFSEFDKKTELSAQQLLDNMKSQIEGVKEWANNLTILAQRGISEGLLQKLSEMGPQGYEYVHAFVEMTAGQLQQANELYAQSSQLPQSTADQLLANYVYVGTMTSGGFQTGIEQGMHGAISACATMGYAGLDALKGALLVASPSQETYAVGQFFVEGMQNGISSLEDTTTEQVRSFAHRLIDTMKAVFNLQKYKVVDSAQKISTESISAINDTKQQYYDAGVNLIEGLIEGMNSKKSEVESTAESIASLALKCMTGKSAFDEASPSKATYEIGSYATQGLILGLNSQANALYQSSEKIANSAVTNLKNAILSISSGIESDIDMDPTIRPVLDLSRVIPQAERINTLFSKNLAIRANTDFSRYGLITDGSGTTVAGSQYVFNQYNTSPKALDRADIYRQTHNQFAWFRGMTQ